jgi:hypothetical protein
MGDAAANSTGKSIAHKKINSFWRSRSSWSRWEIGSSANREVVENGRTESRLGHYWRLIKDQFRQVRSFFFYFNSFRWGRTAK